ncbi:MAG: NUDIX hydrolase [Fibrobacterota bacterium]
MESFRDSEKYKAWAKRLNRAGSRLHRSESLFELHKSGGELLFALVDAEVEPVEGGRLPNVLFLRGDAVVVVTRISCPQLQRSAFAAVRQRRIADGDLHVEFPAGMLDRSVDAPRRVARTELLQETGLSCREEDLVQLCDRPLYSSPGASDEAIWFYGVDIPVSRNEWMDLHGRRAGNPHENEHIEVLLLSEDEIGAAAVSLQVQYGLMLFRRYFSHG